MRKNKNEELIEGYVFSSDLELKVSGENSKNPGTKYISGNLNVATDEDGLNVIPVHYTYVTEFTKKTDEKGNPIKNRTWTALTQIMEGAKEKHTWLDGGKDSAMKVRLLTSADTSDYYRQSDDSMQTFQRNEGGFVNIVTDLSKGVRNRFTLDIMIIGVEDVEADLERKVEEYAKIHAYIFNYKNDMQPFTLIAKSGPAIRYFLSLDASKRNPVYTQVAGTIENTTQVTKKTVESAFGEPSVDVTEKHIREWVINWAKVEPYVIGLDDTITADEINEAMNNRELHLAEVKTRAKKFFESQENAFANNIPVPTTETTASIPDGEFKF